MYAIGNSLDNQWAVASNLPKVQCYKLRAEVIAHRNFYVLILLGFPTRPWLVYPHTADAIRPSYRGIGTVFV